MSYQLPTFNLTCNIWRAGNPTSNPPDVVSPCNLQLGRPVRAPIGTSASVAPLFGYAFCLVPAGTDVRDAKSGAGVDTVEVGAGTGRFYHVLWVEDSGGGFPNEHRVAYLEGFGAWPLPFPRPTGSPPAPPVNGPFFATNSGGANATTTFSMPAGLRIMAVAVGGAGSPPTTVVASSIGGILAPISTWRNTSLGGNNGSLAHFSWASGGGSETVTATTGILTEVVLEGWGLASSGPDATGFASAAGVAGLSVSCTSANANSGEVAMASLMFGDNPPSAGPMWLNYGIGPQVFDSSSVPPLWLYNVLTITPTVGPATVIFGFSPGSAALAFVLIDSFLP
jgi:hypothetical protein